MLDALPKTVQYHVMLCCRTSCSMFGAHTIMYHDIPYYMLEDFNVTHCFLVRLSIRFEFGLHCTVLHRIIHYYFITVCCIADRYLRMPHQNDIHSMSPHKASQCIATCTSTSQCRTQYSDMGLIIDCSTP